MSSLFDVYPLFPIEIVKGEGCKVWDNEGTEYLDCYGGHAVISIGHSHPQYVDAICKQVGQLGFYSNSIINPLQKQLAESLAEVSGYPDYSLFLVNSGAEANENALKLASFHTGRKRVISFSKAFHGRTSLAVATTDNPKIVAPINETDNVSFLSWGDLDAVRVELEKKDVCAVMVEGIQGVGGIQIPGKKFLQGLRKLCTETGTVLILDEIQSGYGRSGKFFAHQHADIQADIISMAKGIANGFPMGALLISPAFKAVYGMLGTTFGGNHLACAAALSVLDVMKEKQLMAQATEVGAYLLSALSELSDVKEVRGLGLMIGVEMNYPIKEVRQKLLFEEHLFTGVSGTHVIRLLPPLVLTMEQAQDAVARIKRVIK